MNRWFSMRRQGGLTLIELIMFIIIVSVGLAGVLSVMNVTVMSSADPVIRKQALGVAEAMMDEVLSKDFQNDPLDAANTSAVLGCTPNSPATGPRCRVNTLLDRQNYNDVDDYQNWNQLGVFQVDGTPAPFLANYRVQVAVALWALNGINGKRVTVTVSGGNEVIALDGFRANF